MQSCNVMMCVNCKNIIITMKMKYIQVRVRVKTHKYLEVPN